MSLFPWDSKTPQVRGRERERELAKELGARLHPMSGAGRVKNDMSTDDVSIESKSAMRSYSLSGDYLAQVWLQAISAGKEAAMVIEFDNGMRLTGTIDRWRRPSG